MKFRFLALLLTAFMSMSLTGCGDGDDSDNPAPVADNGNGGAGNGNGNGNGDDDDDPATIPWALIRFDREHDEDPTCIRPNFDLMIIRENGQFHLEECDGTKDGRLTRGQLRQIRRLAAIWFASDRSRRICAESSPEHELHVRMTLDNGADVNVYEELTAQGLCSNGDRRAALNLYRAVLRAFNFHDIPSPQPEPQPDTAVN